jgi:hypothetical protein
MINKGVMDRVETLEYLKNKLVKKERIVLPRYNDGEYLLMKRLPGHTVHESTEKLSDLLIEAIKVQGQLICINYLKPHNIEKKDIWFDTQQYLMEQANQDLYGCGNWLLHDFCTDSSLLSKFFSGKVLLVAGLADEASGYLKSIQSDMEFYKTHKTNAPDKYEEIKNDLQNICQNYNTILFACGPIGKVLIADFVSLCGCNLIDIGAIINAVTNLTDQWVMSWAKDVNLKEKRELFFDKLRG